MEPTYKHNDLLMVKSWNARSFIQRQKILLIDLPPQYGGKSIKRLIGLPGDKIQFVNGEILINNQKIIRKSTNSKYKIISINPIDLFPNTHHVESITLLKLNK